jgi:hypothetical protein
MKLLRLLKFKIQSKTNIGLSSRHEAIVSIRNSSKNAALICSQNNARAQHKELTLVSTVSEIKFPSGCVCVGERLCWASLKVAQLGVRTF